MEDGDRLARDNAAASSGKGVNARCKVAFCPETMIVKLIVEKRGRENRNDNERIR